MNNFSRLLSVFMDCHSLRNNGLLKFRDVQFEDASVLFYFCSILYERCIFDFHNMTPLIQTPR